MAAGDGGISFSRYPESEWKEELLKMRAAACKLWRRTCSGTITKRSKDNLIGRDGRDLRKFVELCASLKLLVFVRIGPYAHGEARRGGLPDWVAAAGPTRRNDPTYLASVRAYFGQIGRQLNGLFWRQGGPIVGAPVGERIFCAGSGRGGGAHC